ncbi:MAG: short-chain dehydrogenase, partial [Alphaproteobacteria bacterium]|nr:short-chain dehydrogenase [Alphaproteobacteria bacterium]
MTGALAGKRIVVTGAARGLGHAFAAAACGAGARVVLADILEDRGR